jgi:hypothetical protein
MEQLAENGHRVDAYLFIKDYLCTVQQKASKFVQLIEGTLK